ncbi:amidase signature enzyme [Massarina eburnea CBS 473.64]|uniref:Amidase signature enzyme n=1 Tax=Massarina eburnea CBS 473.64 TaxID=1395130 RepID=A0A6A6SG86_9PLEO|nr:amidase signature enzyme [Massarina eburnea CBS 473.64]
MSQNEDILPFKEYISISVGDIDYYLQPYLSASQHFAITYTTSETKLAFVLDSSLLGLPDFPENLTDVISQLQSEDDVFTTAFADKSIFFAQGLYENGNSWETLNNAWERCQGKRKLLNLGTASSVPRGPYFWRGSYLHQAWRLFPDYLDAFFTPVVPTSSRYRFETLKATARHGDTLAVAVPSRLYFDPSPEKPLHGKRIGIKDNIHLEGVRTSNGNRAYADCYGPQSETAALVKDLIDQGAIIVGKQVLNAFAGSEKPPDQCIDYPAPWNPRADGYQRPAGSTSGGGSSVAGYDWIDYALGTDTTGSLREPARVCGLYGLRLTNRVISAKGFDSNSVEIDSYGYLTRSLGDLWNLVKSSLGSAVSDTSKLPKKLLYPTDWFPYQSEEQQALTDEFVKAMEEYLGLQRTEICIAEEWKKTAPESLRDIPISDYLKNSAFWPLYYDSYHNYDQFRADYREKFGKEAYVSPSQAWKWDLGSKITLEERERGLSEINIYKEWVGRHILTTDADGDTETIIILPLGNAEPDYRDVRNKLPQVTPSFDPKYFVSMLGLPQIVVPIAQFPYESRVSKMTEYIPIVATFAGPQRSELTLIKVAEAALRYGAYPESVLAGRFMFPVAKNLRHTSGVGRKL